MKQVFEKLCQDYQLNINEQEELFCYIKDIYNHDEFQKRCANDFCHHDQVSLGRHILEDAIVTYKKCRKKKNIELDTALLIAMFHDLYTSPWQNSDSNQTKFVHKHGFRHPIEAVVNAITWFPEYFNDYAKAEKIIDGIIHHMYPLPVCCLKGIEDNYLELMNYDYLLDIDPYLLKLIYKSSNRGRINNISIIPSKYKEGRMMARADKKVSLNNFKNTSFKSKLALLTGKNNNLKEK